MKRDAPEKDPHVQAIDFDVTSLAPAEFERHGIVLVPKVVPVRGEAEAWVTHSSFLFDEGREFDVYERSVARRLARDHVERAGSLKGLRLRRSFPCTGMLRVVSEGRRMVEVACDRCGTDYGVARAPERKPPGANPETPFD